MTEFETQNTVDVVIDDRSLTEARADVEDALSSVPIDVQASVSGGGGSEVAARDRARQRQLLTTQTDSIDELREEFAEKDVASEWQEQHALSRERNRLLEQIAEGIDEGNFDRASRGGGSLGMIMGGGALLGVGALSGVLSSFSWPSLPEFGAPDWLPPEIEKPGWTPIGVEEPAEAPVEDPAEAPVADPKEAPVEEPEKAEVEKPPKAEAEKPPDAEVAEPDFKVQVEEPEPAGEGSGESGANEPGPVKTILGLLGAAGGAAGAYALRNGGSTAARGAAGAASGAGMILTPEGIGITDHEKMNNRKRTWNKHTPDALNAEMMKESEEHPGSVFSAEGRKAQAEGVRDLVNALKDFREDVRSTQEDTPSARRTEVNIESNVSVDGATRREVERGFENAKQEALRELNREIRGRR